MEDGSKEKKWQQSLGEAEYYVKYLCPQGGLIVDQWYNFTSRNLGLITLV
jgi:hypothetical protein